MTPDELFDRLADRLAQRPDVSRNGRGSLVREGVRAMTSRGRIVVRLSPRRVLELADQGHGRHYKDQVNAWLDLDPALPEDQVEQLVEESLR